MTGFTLLLALAPLTTQAGKPVGPEASLRRGQYLRAIQLFSQQIQSDPSNEPARIGLGRAQIALGRCEQGRNSLSGLRQSPHWSALSATAEGTCALRAGNASLAITAFEEAVLMDPNHERGWYGLFRAQMLGDELTAAAVSLTELDESPQATGLFPTAELALDWATTAVDVDTRLQGLLTGVEDSPAPMATRLALVASAERWLDLGDPRSARAELLGVHHRYPSNVRAAGLLAEAHRRLGDIQAAEAVLSHSILMHSDQPLMLSLRIRLAHDRGQDPTTLTDWSKLRSLQNAEVYATQWYVLRHLDPTTASLANGAWETHTTRPDQDLNNLIPWGNR